MNKEHQWRWRTDEVVVAEFRKLTSTAKQEHIQFLLTLPVEQLSTNDEYILRWYGPDAKSNNNFISLND
jgi:isochorismate hydrolase